MFFIPDLDKLSPDFIWFFLRIMDGETDPRCLLLAFKCFERIATTFPIGRYATAVAISSICRSVDIIYLPVGIYLSMSLILGHIAEELFDIISCYFPVEYIPVCDTDRS